MTQKESTQDRIVSAAIELVTERGYIGTTTKAIAERAGVNEVTLFRHFGNKKGIIEAAIDRYSFIDNMRGLFNQFVSWDLQKDLQMIARLYHEQMNKKRQIIMLSIREAEQFPELDKQLSKIPMDFKEILIQYFDEMKKLGKMQKQDSAVLATNFIYINFGYFLIKKRLLEEDNEVSLNQFIEVNLCQFINGIL